MKSKKSTILITVIALIVALMHFVIGPNYQGLCKGFLRSYLLDILLPMSTYLLFQLAARKQISVLYSRFIGALAVFILGLVVEISQYYGLDFLGSTYDSFDIICYAFGIFLGLMIDIFIISRLERTKRIN